MPIRELYFGTLLIFHKKTKEYRALKLSYVLIHLLSVVFDSYLFRWERNRKDFLDFSKFQFHVIVSKFSY